MKLTQQQRMFLERYKWFHECQPTRNQLIAEALLSWLWVLIFYLILIIVALGFEYQAIAFYFFGYAAGVVGMRLLEANSVFQLWPVIWVLPEVKSPARGRIRSKIWLPIGRCLW